MCVISSIFTNKSCPHEVFLFRWAGVAEWFTTVCLLPAAHSCGFQHRHQQKSKTGVSVTPRKGLGVLPKSFFIARVRSTREGTVFTGVCSHLGRGGTYLVGGGGGGTYSQGGGGTYSQVWTGVPTFPGLDGGGGGYLLSGLDGGGGVPTLRSGWGGGVPTQVWAGGVPT